MSCGKLPNHAKSLSDSTVFVNPAVTSDKTHLIPLGDDKSEYGYDNPLMYPKQLTLVSSDSSPGLSASTGYTGDRLPVRADYVTSRMKYGNITNGSSLKIFSYNLIDDSLQGTWKLSETSFIDISKSTSSHVCVTDVVTGSSEVPKKNGFPIITHVKPLHSNTPTVADLELESLNHDDRTGNLDLKDFEMSDSPTAHHNMSINFPSRLKKRLVCDNDEQFMLMVLGGKVSSDNLASKDLLLWQCTITPFS